MPPCECSSEPQLPPRTDSGVTQPLSVMNSAGEFRVGPAVSAIFSAKSADLATITSGISEQANVPEITIPAPMEEKEESFGFFDFLDIINPLQHIPIVGTIYRHITGDEIGVVAQVAGGALFGGAIGAAAGVATAAIEHQTGKDIGSAFMDAFRSPSSIESGLDGTTIAIMDMKSRERTYNN